MATLTTIIITRNEEANLERCLRGVDWSDEIIIVDSGSTDRTEEIARAHRARFFTERWKGYAEQKNSAMAKATSDWILSIDADEELPAETQATIRRIVAQQDEGISGYIFRRKVYYLGRWITHGDWYPDEILRLWKRGHGRFVGKRVHESVLVEGPTRTLQDEILHYSYADLEDQTERSKKYARLWAEGEYERGRKPNVVDAWFRPAWRLARGFLLRAGFLDGWRGWLIAWNCARETHWKYRELSRLRRGAPDL
ncbi:MAG: glycosyltransferase family 2 protein [Verrucomicrobiae bacterium]|nr:glycosyltransferase family 2 protein [Verrucomicrobiae bacterium]